MLHAREVARRTLEGELDVPAAEMCGIGADDKKSLRSRAAKEPARTTQPARAGRESWESWETDVRRSTSSQESVAMGGVAAVPTRNIRTPDQQITDPVALQGTGAPSRPRVRRVRSGDRLSQIMRRETPGKYHGLSGARDRRCLFP